MATELGQWRRDLEANQYANFKHIPKHVTFEEADQYESNYPGAVEDLKNEVRFKKTMGQVLGSSDRTGPTAAFRANYNVLTAGGRAA